MLWTTQKISMYFHSGCYVFRSDDTALSAKEKQRVWCHTVYMTPDKENVLHTQPLPISSVAVSKNCFRLIDAETGQPFDIEDELYERLTAGVVNDIIHEHNFSRLVTHCRKIFR
jgi:subtilase family serine protease